MATGTHIREIVRVWTSMPLIFVSVHPLNKLCGRAHEMLERQAMAARKGWACPAVLPHTRSSDSRGHAGAVA